MGYSSDVALSTLRHDVPSSSTLSSVGCASWRTFQPIASGDTEGYSELPRESCPGSRSQQIYKMPTVHNGDPSSLLHRRILPQKRFTIREHDSVRSNCAHRHAHGLSPRPITLTSNIPISRGDATAHLEHNRAARHNPILPDWTSENHQPDAMRHRRTS